MKEKRSINLDEIKSRINDSLDSIQFIEMNIYNINFEEFKQNEMIKSSILWKLFTLLDNIKEISNMIEDKYSDVFNWREPIKMRDRLGHGYMIINYKIIWDTIRHDLQPIKEGLKFILNDLFT